MNRALYLDIHSFAVGRQIFFNIPINIYFARNSTIFIEPNIKPYYSVLTELDIEAHMDFQDHLLAR